MNADMKRLEQYDAFDIPLKDIFYDESFNCRGAFTVQSLNDLSASISKIGLKFPIAVQPWEDHYRLLAGHRRFKAVNKLLGWKTIPAVIYKGLDEHQARILNITENLERKDLNILEEAKAIAALYPDGVSLRVAAKELKRPTRWVHIRLRLLELPEKVQMKAALGLLSAVNIEAICQLPEEEQVAAAEMLAKFKKEVGTRKVGRKVPITRSFRDRKSKDQLSKMAALLLNAGLDGLSTRLIAWAAGYLSDVDIKKDIKHYAKDYKFTDKESPFGREDTDT